MSRPRPTAVDYVVIALSPALIMTLVGSLAFFLVHVFYQGQHSVRLQIILGLFVFAAVLISRIAIESGKGRAVLFALPLAIATGLAMMRFSEIRGNLAGFSSLLNFAILGIVWWCTHKLTMDCTVLDESKVQTEQGLLQFIGLDGKTEPPAPTPRPSLSTASETETADGWRLQAWWKRLSNPPRKPHTHGVWVVYFSLAALPLFGIGQLFIRGGDASGRRYTFTLLCLYLLSGFGLLITTSLISLRRYLRQRDLQMPGAMVKTWVVAGAVLVLAVLSAVWLLPRGIGDFGVTRAPLLGSRNDLSTTEMAVGNDGPRHEPGAAKVNENLRDDDGTPVEGTEGEGGRQAQGGDQKTNNRNSASNSNSESDSSQQTKSEGKRGDNPESQQSDGNRDPSSTRQASTSDQSAQRRGDEDEQPSSTDYSQSAKPNSANQIMETVVDGVWNVLRYAFYAALAGVAVFLAWKYRRQVLSAWHEFVAELRALWNRLLRRRGKSEHEPGLAASSPEFADGKPFAAFQDPFASGAAANWSAEQLVRYTFAALEAWAAERATPRDPQQTPTEFADLIAGRFREIHGEALDLCNLYCQAAYASVSIDREQVMPLAALWRKLSRSASAL